MRRQRQSSNDNNSSSSSEDVIIPPILNVVLMTQNIGAADPFDGPKDMDKTVVPAHIKDLWIRWQRSCAEMLRAEERRLGGPVDVFVLHIQEIGGKGYSAPMIRFLDETHRDCHPSAGWSSGLMMQRENDVKTFTALGSFIFLSERVVAGASFLDFRTRQYIRVVDLDGNYNNNSSSSGSGGENNNSHNNNNNDTNDSSNSNNNNNDHNSSNGTKVPGEGHAQTLQPTGLDPAATSSSSQQPHPIWYSAKFVNADTSRKGFIFVSLRIGQRVVNLINMHLFHDADNTVAVSVSPSPYVSKRIESFTESLAETACLVDEDDCLFIFGDLNLRLDQFALIEEFKKLGLEPKVDKKKIQADPEFWATLTDPRRWGWLKQFDKEVPELFHRSASEYNQRLLEAPVQFGPTYLVAEDEVKDLDASEVRPDDEQVAAKRAIYQKTRFPAWCDRVFFNEPAYQQFVESSTTRDFSIRGEPKYGPANLVHMDHLSVALRFHFKV